MTARKGTLFFAIAFAGCSSPRQAEPPKRDAASDELGHALRFVESIEDGGQRPIDSDRQLVALDYRSRLSIAPDRALLREVAGATADLLPPLTAGERERLALLRDLADLVAQLGGIGGDVEQQLAELEQSRSAGRIPTDEQESRAEAIARREQFLRRRILERVDALVRADLERELDPAAKEFDAAVAARVATFRQGGQADSDLPDLRRFQELLESKARELEQTLATDRGRLESDSTALRLRARLHSGGKTMPVHVENYDTLDLRWDAKEPLISVGSDDDRERVRVEAAALQSVLALRESSSAPSSSDPSALLAEVGELLRADVERMQAAPRALRPAKASAPVPLAGPDGLIAFAKAGADAGAAPPLDALDRFVLALQQVGETSRALRRARADGGELMSRLLLETEMLLQEAARPELEHGLEALEARLLERRAELDSGGGERVEAAIARMGEEVGAALVDARRTLLRLELAAAAAHARRLSATASLAAATLDPRLLPPAPRELVAGEIDLNSTVANRGDQLEVIAEVLHRHGDEEEIFPSVRRTFSIDRFGLINSLSADVAFVRQTGTEHFRPAPAAAWTLHYRIPSEPDDSFGTKVWQVLDPGVGLSATAFSTDTESFQAGVGPHLSLFQDIVRGGWGYNLSADTNRGYVFISIGIFETIQGIGTLMTGRFGSAPTGFAK